MSAARTQQAGFSLIELLVSLSIFTIVVTMSVGSLLVLIDANSKAQNIQSSLTNVLFAIDSISREVRTGTHYVCSNSANPPSTVEAVTATGDCAGLNNTYLSIVEGGSSLTAGGNPRVSYFYESDFTEDGETRGAILRRIGDDTSGPDNGWYPLTAASIDIDAFGLFVSGTDTGGDTDQPAVLMIVGGQAGDFIATDTRFSLQSYVTQRILDI